MWIMASRSEMISDLPITLFRMTSHYCPLRNHTSFCFYFSNETKITENNFTFSKWNNNLRRIDAIFGGKAAVFVIEIIQPNHNLNLLLPMNPCVSSTLKTPIDWEQNTRKSHNGPEHTVPNARIESSRQTVAKKRVRIRSNNIIYWTNWLLVFGHQQQKFIFEFVLVSFIWKYNLAHQHDATRNGKHT